MRAGRKTRLPGENDRSGPGLGHPSSKMVSEGSHAAAE